jgi:hypothetical protein
LIKLASIVTLAGIVIPTNIFVYGTTDTDYVSEISSTIEVSELQLETEKETEENSDSSNTIPTSLASILGINTDESEEVSLVYGEELTGYNIVLMSDEDEDTLNEKYGSLTSVSTTEIEDCQIVDLTVNVESESIEEESSTLVTKKKLSSYSGPSDEYSVVTEYKQNTKVEVTTIEKDGYVLLVNDTCDEWIDKSSLCTESEYTKSLQGNALLDIDNPDTDYTGQSISLTAEDRDILERLVMGEAGDQGYIGAALVAQCIRDTMIYKGYSSVESVRTSLKYSGSLKRTPNQDVLDAVSYIFDEGGYAVRHKVFYFYAPKLCTSTWHESRPFVVEYEGHRFFS